MTRKIISTLAVVGVVGGERNLGSKWLTRAALTTQIGNNIFLESLLIRYNGNIGTLQLRARWIEHRREPLL
jgi:hypothetical protein